MGKTRVFAMLGVAFTLLVFPAEQVGANPYTAGYEAESQVVQTNEVLIEVDFFTDSEVFPDGEWLGGVSSVAGAVGDQPSGNVYQNVLALKNDWNVFYWAPQVWFGDSLTHIEEIPVSTGSYAAGSYAAFYLRTDIFNGGVIFRIWAYRTFDDYFYDTPSYYSLRTWSTTDSNLLV